MPEHKVIEKFWEAAGFTVHVVKLPVETLSDKLAVLSDGSGHITSIRYDQFLLNSCIVDGEKIHRYLDSLDDDVDKIYECAEQIRGLIVEENPHLDPLVLIFNNENIMKIYDPEKDGDSVRRVVDNPDWNKPEITDMADLEDIEEFFRNMPPPVFGIPGMGDNWDPDKLEAVIWEDADLPIVLVRYSKNDLANIFKDKYVFPHKDAYMAYIVTRCVQDVSQLFMLLDQVKKTEKLGGADKVISKLYELCIDLNPFLSWETIDLERVKKIVYRKHGAPNNKFTKPNSKACTGCSTDTETAQDEYREFDDLTEEEILSLSSRVKKWVIGQDEAVDAVCEGVELASCGMKELHAPIGVYMLTGDTGVGKTHLAKMLSQELCGSEYYLTRIDCSEYSQRHEVSKLIGSPNGYVGYDDVPYFVESLKKRPFCITLFDEIEKAHPTFFNILLQIMDEGRLTTNKGEVLTFGQSVILMTSNLGVKEVNRISGTVGFGDVSVITPQKRAAAIKEALKGKFKPEFLNRVDKIITFNTLNKEHCKRIVELAFNKVNEWLSDKNIEVIYSPEVVEYIYSKGFTPGYGARPLKRAMKKYIFVPISRAMLKENKRSNCIITLGIENNEIKFGFTEKESEEDSEVSENIQFWSDEETKAEGDK